MDNRTEILRELDEFTNNLAIENDRNKLYYERYLNETKLVIKRWNITLQDINIDDMYNVKDIDNDKWINIILDILQKCGATLLDYKKRIFYNSIIECTFCGLKSVIPSSRITINCYTPKNYFILGFDIECFHCDEKFDIQRFETMIKDVFSAKTSILRDVIYTTNNESDKKGMTQASEASL